MDPKMDRILLATDVHPRSDRVLERAAMLASALNAELHITHVTESTSEDSHKIAKSELDRFTGDDGVFCTAIPAASPLVPVITTSAGTAAEVISDQIADLRPRIVVMGLGRDFTMTKIFTGSTVDSIVASGMASVLVVKTRPVSQYKECVVAFDGSTQSRLALETAIWVAPDAHITIVHATKSDMTRRPEQDDVEDRISSHVRTIITEFAALTSQPPRDFTLHIEGGEPIDVVLSYVRKENPDLVALGQTQKTGLKTLVPGSSTSLLLAHLDCDTVVASKPG